MGRFWMSRLLTDSEEYIEARKHLNTALREVADSGVDITSNTFRVLFRAEVLKLFELVLDDPKTYDCK